MTWSIVARDPSTGHLGIAVVTRFFAVGALVPYIRGGIGAVATQAFVSPLYGVDGLSLLAAGKAPEEIIADLTARDAKPRSTAAAPHRCEGAQRRLHRHRVHRLGGASDRRKRLGRLSNMLAGPDVVAETLATYNKAMDKPLAERLLLAMQAGEDA